MIKSYFPHRLNFKSSCSYWTISYFKLFVRDAWSKVQACTACCTLLLTFECSYELSKAPRAVWKHSKVCKRLTNFNICITAQNLVVKCMKFATGSRFKPTCSYGYVCTFLFTGRPMRSIPVEGIVCCNPTINISVFATTQAISIWTLDEWNWRILFHRRKVGSCSNFNF